MTRTHLISLVILAALNGCKSHDTGGTPDDYIENNLVWAHGSVQLTSLSGPSGIVLNRQPGVQTVNTYTLVGTENGAGEHDLAYVDYHPAPASNRLLAYWYSVGGTTRAGNPNVVDVFATLRKQGRTVDSFRVHLGTATFAANAAQGQVRLADGLKLSLIADGVYSGHWALHYPAVQNIVVKPWAGLCPKTGPTQTPGQGPGQNPGQNPGQFDQCQPLPPDQDLCKGDPTQASCRPKPPVQQPGQQPNDPGQQPGQPSGGLEPVPGETDVWIMPADMKEAKFVFPSQTLAAATDEENAALCAAKFYAVGRTTGGVQNQACELRPAPTSPQNGRLACALTVTFNDPKTYLEKICEISAVFRTLPEDVRKVQVLKR